MTASFSNHQSNYQRYTTLIEQGDAYRRLFQFKKSFEKLIQAIQLEPNNFEAYYKTALVYWTQQNHIKTAKMLRYSLMCNPSTYWKNVLKGFIHELNHRILDAQRCYKMAADYVEKSTESIESGMEAYLNLGFVELDLHNYRNAIEMFQKALARQEQFHERIDRLEALYGHATTQCGRTLTHKPVLIATCYNNIGHTYVHMGKDEKAVKYFTKAIAIFGHDLFFLKNRIKAYSRLNQYENVIQDCDKALSLDISDPHTVSEIYSFRGSAYYNLNRDDLALRDFKSANAKHPLYHYPYIMLSYMALLANRMDEASSMIDRGIECCDRTYSLQSLYSFRVSYLSKTDLADNKYRERLKDMNGDILARIS